MNVIPFGEASCLEVSTAGGKGASLARMTSLGLPVPPGFVIPASALAEALPDGGRELRAVVADDDHAAAAGRAHEILAALELPAQLRGAIADAYAGLGDADRRLASGAEPAMVAGDPPVAVRSSATAEDSEEASFAGQQETFLHVRGADDVVGRVRDCWASFFSERALFYRARKGSLEDLGMAVVVQRMVEADVAGVLFTCDPVRKRRDRMVVEAVLGLGEGVVSGQLTPDHYILKRDGRVRKAQVHVQPYAIVALPEGGTSERELDPEIGGAQKVADEHLAALARLGDDLEQRLGAPQDIEWAVQGGEIFVLQARPVTA